ncbi:MAG: SH3 domain-containing protein [Hyphomicrobiaceae bacterium]
MMVTPPYRNRRPLNRVQIAASLVLTIAVPLTLPCVASAADPKAPDAAAPGKLALPRFTSLKPSRANLRSGPGTEYPTVWVYRREGLPLEVIKEFEGWRQVRDADGASGWVLQSFLSGRRTALIEPWEAKPGVTPPQIALLADDSEKAQLVAKVEAGVIANVLSCDGKWCWVGVDKYKGYVQQKKLWGVYEAEVLK